MMNVKDLIELARDTAKRGSPSGPSAGRPKTVYLNRAVSTAYQAIFLALCKCAADIFVGEKPRSSSDTGWVQVYRAVEHRKARKVCDNKKIWLDIRKGSEISPKFLSKVRRCGTDPTMILSGDSRSRKF